MYTKTIIFLIIICTTLFAQDKKPATLSGFVYDTANGEALIGANVYLENTTIGGSTNVSGDDVIPNMPIGQHVIICEYMGYEKYRKQMVTI